MQEQAIEGFRLSSQQKRLWSLQQGCARLPYHAQCAVLIEGSLNRKVLQAALQNVIDRHEVLRTTFHCLAQMSIPLQVIRDSRLSWDGDVDLSGANPEEEAAKIDALFSELRQLPCDFRRTPVVRLSLANLSGGKQILFVSLPALYADKASIQNLVREIGRSYAAGFAGEEISDEPMQYADFCQWQNELLESEDMKTGREYWHKPDLSTVTLKLPFERQNPGVAEFEPRCLSSTINGELLENINALVRTYETSASVFLMACWHILFWRLTGHSDSIVGTAFDGRKYKELKGALGLFEKYLPLHCNLEGNLTFREILQQVNDSTRDFNKWQEYFDCDQIITSTRAFFFSIAFDFEQQTTNYSAGDVSFSIYKQYACVEPFKIKLSCVDRDGVLITEFHYDSNLLDVDEIKRLAGQFHCLLERVIRNPLAPISTLEILSNAERQFLLLKLNNTRTAYRTNKCVHEIFEEQVSRTPESIAVTFEDRQLTYTQLNAQSNQVAFHLKTLGVGPEVRVAIAMEPSPEMMIGLLGIFKAGGAYVPLDPAYPKERLAFLLADSQVPVLLTQQLQLENFPAHGTQAVCLDVDWQSIAQQSEENAVSCATAENIAYVMYTSGSTGRPKGVMIEHRNLVNYLFWVNANLLGDAVETLPLITNLTFDACLKQLFAPLLCGREIRILSRQVITQPAALLAELQTRSRVGLNCVPSLWKILLDTIQSGQVPVPTDRLSSLFVGGEQVSKELIHETLEVLPNLLMWNLYGVTEATANSIVGRIGSGDRVIIGRPIANTEVYILDSHLQPVPIHVPGELYIGGAGLARGYDKRPDLTAERFIPHPFTPDCGARLYRTGDVARYLPDGNIEFLGRTDHQVKIRGFRIEMGEIEAVLSQHPAVQQTLILAMDTVDVAESGGENQKSKTCTEPTRSNQNPKLLAAYVVPKSEQAPGIEELRRFLKENLPDYMVPSSFLFLDSLPLLPNGKVDRRALPASDQSRAILEVSYVAPRNPVEEVLARIWTEVLKLEKVSTQDNFFDLGGHSLLAIRVISRVREAFELDLPLRSVFELPTIAEFANAIQKAKISGAETPAAGISPISRELHRVKFPVQESPAVRKD